MLYNSKKLVDEKVFQQYYFERFMTASMAERKNLLPPQFGTDYAPTTSVKVLRPEVSLEKGFLVDFILYHLEGKAPLNIELKWQTSDFYVQTNRHKWFNGTSGIGFVVALQDDADLSSQIPTVILDQKEFQEWFVENSRNIVSQALYRKLALPFRRLTGSRYWLVYIGKDSKDHYIQAGLRDGIWAFKDRNPANKIMRILEGDHIIFVRPKSSNPPRLFVADNEPNNEKRRSVHNQRLYKNDEINWAIQGIDIFPITQGYHLNFTADTPYDVFESQVWQQSSTPESKEYTQFIRFETKISDGKTTVYDFDAHAPAGHILERKLFPARVQPLGDFVDAVRKACANRGDIVEISETTFQAMRALLPK